MSKKSILLLVFLLAVTSGLLIWQWEIYSENTKENLKHQMEQAVQHITIEATGKELKVTQTVTGLGKDKEYQILKPDHLFRWQCIDGYEENCKSFSQESHIFLADKGELRFTFVIPIQQQSAFLLTDWTTTIKNVDIKETTIDIVEKEKRDSTWVAGLPQTGYERLSLIDFYAFKGKGGTPSIYWDPNPFEKKTLSKSLAIYGNPLFVQSNSYQIPELMGGEEFIAIIYTDSVNPYTGQGIKIVSPSSQVEVIERELMNDYYFKKFLKLSKHEQWVIDLLTALTLETPPAHPKSEFMLAELSLYMTEKERKLFLQAVQKEEKLINFQMLNQMLGNSKGLETTFFSANQMEESEWTPLFFIDQRQLIVNDRITSIHIVHRKNQMLLPFVETMEAMGFQVKSDDDIFYVSNTKEQYTFFLNQPIFTHNGTDFGLLENPLYEEIAGVYITNKTLQTIFRVSIIEEQLSIVLKNDSQGK
ncbi:hypothetical protein [Niallia endozanthoxylica]|uniref:Copper amine oxidase-like N-terminal domain-containing protein n=1 Tax=Niallia endozanthoxylica TaxID=2036016 RepID=A0A5J5HTY1_9BACI|nr:hypothetical protein [Niallia endozanthoxylica]KAA9025989.1 hypothetical protein F4V44_08900 [Niallia endozanthoxylica]